MFEAKYNYIFWYLPAACRGYIVDNCSLGLAQTLRALCVQYIVRRGAAAAVIMSAPARFFERPVASVSVAADGYEGGEIVNIGRPPPKN